jgi:hypothetical protein
MRRVLSICLVLFFGIGPFPAALGTSDDARVPACCRRHGTHHCVMNEDPVAQSVRSDSGSSPFLSAPSRCPLYPGDSPATTSPIHALAGPFASMNVSLVVAHSPAAQKVARCIGQIRTHAGRGPPNLIRL